MATVRFSPRKKNSMFGSLSVTFILIIVNVAVFFLFYLYLAFSGISDVAGLESVYNYVALKPSNIFQGMYLWTFLTSMFMHGGFFHIFANMFSLLFIGTFIERILGKKRYFWFYMISGLAAGAFFVLLSLVFPSDFNAFAVGASGALFGVAGLMVILTPNLPLYVMFIPIPIKAKYAIPGLLVVLWLVSIAGDIPIGNTAHFGGLLAGIVYGIYLRKKYKRKTVMISRNFS